MPITPLELLALALPFYLVANALYRAFFDSLSKFPGPKLAAVTGLYEFFYNFVNSGQFSKRIAESHESYGMFKVCKWILPILTDLSP
jgi:hypothetical protein